MLVKVFNSCYYCTCGEKEELFMASSTMFTNTFIKPGSIVIVLAEKSGKLHYKLTASPNNNLENLIIHKSKKKYPYSSKNIALLFDDIKTYISDDLLHSFPGAFTRINISSTNYSFNPIVSILNSGITFDKIDELLNIAHRHFSDSALQIQKSPCIIL